MLNEKLGKMINEVSVNDMKHLSESITCMNIDIRNDKLKSLSEKSKEFEKNLFRNLEIKVLGNKIHTGEDTKLLIDGKSILGSFNNGLQVTKLEWDISGQDVGVIKLHYCKHIETEPFIVDEPPIIIDYPIKDITIETKYFTIKSNNVGKDTVILHDGKEIQSELGISGFSYCIGSADEINELELVVC